MIVPFSILLQSIVGYSGIKLMYDIKKIIDDDATDPELRTCYLVTETETGTDIKLFTKYNDARAYIKFLKSGGGFDGHTPNFMGVRR